MMPESLDTLKLVWFVIFVVLFFYGIGDQVRLYKYHSVMARTDMATIDKYRPKFFLLRYNEQWVFSRYLKNKAYMSSNVSEELQKEGEICRRIYIRGARVGIAFALATFLVIVLQWFL
jgi:hypothetical protein